VCPMKAPHASSAPTTRAERWFSKLPALLLTFVSTVVVLFPAVQANDIHAQNGTYGSQDYIYSAGTGSEHSFGQGFTMPTGSPATGFSYQRLHHFGVVMAKSGTAGYCVYAELRTDYASSAYATSSCVADYNLPGTPSWVNFNFPSTISVNPGQTYFLMVRYYGSCTNCVLVFNGGAPNYYGSSAWPEVRIGAIAGTYYQYSGDLSFLVAIDHTPLMVSKRTQSESQQSTGIQLTMVGGNNDDSGRGANVYTNWGHHGIVRNFVYGPDRRDRLVTTHDHDQN
ncbi:MAG: hypothetical protein LC623_04470, partial [Halobacteriales archaeon]|nr:hypothetical protein [Halobacteriales archaeon]